MKKHQLPLLINLLAPIQFYSTVATALPSKRFNLTNVTSNKADAIPEELKSCALETIEERYPANESQHEGRLISARNKRNRRGMVL
ncbi:uncharacterized protein TNCV_4650901 [Trichonephila clavipes]|nr:uncharacterized protein TNCV_4650901 [Trichonephila clavipes]